MRGVGKSEDGAESKAKGKRLGGVKRIRKAGKLLPILSIGLVF